MKDKEYTELESALRIDPNALDEALMIQPEAFYRVAKEYALAVSRRDELHQTVSEIKAQQDISIRSRAKTKTDKITEKEIEAEVRKSKAVITATTEYLAAASEVNELAALKESYQQRAYALKDLVALHIANYYGDATQSSGNSRLRDHNAESNKRAMADQRRANRDR